MPEEMSLEEGEVTPVFYEREVYNRAASEREGRPVYDLKEYVEIIIPGSHDKVDRPVKDEDRERFSTAYQRWKEKKEPAQEGWPIEEYQGVTRSQAATLKHMNIKTVEQLASVSDNHLDKIGPGARSMKEQAKQALQGDKALKEENERLKAELEEMRERLSQLEGANGKESPDLEDMKKDELLSYAQEQGVEVNQRMSKGQIVEAVRGDH